MRDRLAVVARVRRPADVHRPHATSAHDLERVVEPPRNAEAPGEVPARAERDQAELDPVARAGAREAVDDLVHRPVAADDDERRRAGRRCLGGELGEVPGALADQRLPLEAQCGRAPRELWPAPAGRAVRRRRVHEEHARHGNL